MSEGNDGGGVEEDRGKVQKNLATKDTKEHKGKSEKATAYRGFTRMIADLEIEHNHSPQRAQRALRIEKKINHKRHEGTQGNRVIW
jgi:hypothetical protein